MVVVAMYALIVFSALLASCCLLAEGLPHQFSVSGNSKRIFHVPNGKVHVYKYTAESSAGQNEPAPYATKLQIQGKLIHKQGDPHLKFVDYLKFHNVTHTVYNGPDDGKVHGDYKLLDNSTKDFEEPILLVYDSFDNFQGIKMQEREIKATWSKNMKMALALLMPMHVQHDMKSLKKLGKSLNYQILETTIHGDCQVSYSINMTDVLENGKKLYYLRKNYEPRSCSNFVQHVMNDGKNMYCGARTEEDLVTFTEKNYQFELVNDYFLLKKIVSREKFEYLPYLHRSAGIQYIETSQTYELEKVIDESELSLPVVNFKDAPLVSDVTFDSQSIVNSTIFNYGSDFTKTGDVVDQVKELLILLVDYLKENQIESDHNQKDLLLALHRHLQKLDSETLHSVYNTFDFGTEKQNMIRNIFLEMVPHLGTYAAWNFTKNAIINNEIPDEATAIRMLSNLPMYVLNPTEEFAKSMVQFRNFHKVLTSTKIIHAGILCYSILLHKTYKNVGKNAPEYLRNELQYFFERIKTEPTYESKIVYIMALRNVEVGNIFPYLKPLIDGLDIFERKTDKDYSEKYRRAAMWAAANSIYYDETFNQNNQFWNILTNSSESMSLRLTAYELLVSRNPKLDMNLLMKVNWMMTEEEDEHIFNYHYTTMKSMAESTDPCLKGVSELARKILRLTRRRNSLSSSLSSVSVFDFYDSKYGYGKTFKLAVWINEIFGLPQFGYYEMITNFIKSKLDTGIYWNADGINLYRIFHFIDSQWNESILKNKQTHSDITDEKVINLLKQTYGYEFIDKDIHLEFWTSSKGFITNVQVIPENGLYEHINGLVSISKPRNFMDSFELFNKNKLDIYFHNQYKMIVATEVGIPAAFCHETPSLSYIKFKSNIHRFDAKEKTMIAMKLEFESKMHYHSRYKMKFYNPFTNLQQYVSRVVFADFAFPIDLTIGAFARPSGLQITLPRLPQTRLSVAGLKVQTYDQVKISNDLNEVLRTYCPACEHAVNITNESSRKINHENIVHSKVTGLEFSYKIYNCENYLVPTMPSTDEYKEIFRIFIKKEYNGNEHVWPTILMKLYHQLFNFVHAPYVNTCGKILKMSPSTLHPTTHIEINLRSIDSKDVNEGINLKIEGSVETKVNHTNETGSSWDINLDVVTSPLKKDLKLELTKKRTPLEKTYKVCLDARKVYPNFAMESAVMKPETNAKITLNMGYNDDENCSFDGYHTELSVAIKGELLDEQIEQQRNNVRPGSCFKNPMNPLDFDVTQRFDWNCLHEAIKGTFMRKYTYNVTYNNIPQEVSTALIIFDDYLRYSDMQYLLYKSNHTEPGNIKILVAYSMNDNHCNITVTNPRFTYELVGIQYGSDDPKNRQNDIILDNVGFNKNFWIDYYMGQIRPCIAHVNDVITDLNQTIPMEFKDWTLLLGDYELMSYAVFVKAIENKMSVRIYASKDILEIQSGDALPIVMFNGMKVENYETGLLLTIAGKPDSYFKLTMVNQQLFIEKKVLGEFKVFFSPYNVIVLPHIILYRSFSGVCGNMGSKAYVQRVPLIYK